MTEAKERSLNIAVIGGGVAGILAAYLLQQRHQVSLFEANAYLGGHTNTVEIPDGPDAGLAVDTGFIVLNDVTYPLFQRFLGSLGVPTRDAEMSFGFQCAKTGLVYAGNNLGGLFAQRRNLASPRFWSLLFEIARFGRLARSELFAGCVPQVTLGDYLRQNRFSSFMIENYLLPMAAAIWSTPALQVADFPAETFLRFFSNHGLLSLRNRPQWKTVVGGSYSYVKAFCKNFRGRIELGAPVAKVFRGPERVRVRFHDGASQDFDRLVVASHADQALRLLGDPSEEETRLLGAWRYQLNRTVLHTDDSLLPKLKSAWAAWNFTRESGGDDQRPAFVTYYMNLLQGFHSRKHYCVTLNRRQPFAPESEIAEFDYHHPQYTFESLATQPHLARLNGRRQTWFCGSYFGYGFHEDAVRSAVAVGRDFGVDL
ncbi:amine oxidase [Desulfuromonas versatilis]|uniref:Amine oxidase n=1 Tax=Desulfuromonas versatilis TaxID=2802975 RepID=A0ABM8HW23_9BACT|nr:FAD-dependent oxidoreductase [Desulfuromonas versatilis]BCR04945.1 amine oxidase [Desulfuromonas versatilis]